MKSDERSVERVVGRYAVYGEIASGGMATVHFGRLLGPVGFSRTVAIKRLHAQFAKDPEFVSMFLDEARIAARIQHPNTVATLDVVALEGELFLVMEYVQGEALSTLLRGARAMAERPPLPIVGSVMTGMLHGLHAAHEARSERGVPLGIVHRDVSPQNVIVGIDGVARVLDFGVAKAAGRVQTTREGQLKGKLAYMSPEQLRGGRVDRRVDIYAAAVVLWEILANGRLFSGDNEGEVLAKILESAIEPPSAHHPRLAAAIDAVVMRGLARDPNARYATARDFAMALEDVLPLASPRQVGEWVERIAGASLAQRAEQIKEIESISSNVMLSAVADSVAPKGSGAESRGWPPISTAMSRPSASDVTDSPEVSSLSVSGRKSFPASRAPGRSKVHLIAASAVGAAVSIGAGVLLARNAEAPRDAPVATGSHRSVEAADRTASATAQSPAGVASAVEDLQIEFGAEPTASSAPAVSAPAPRLPKSTNKPPSTSTVTHSVAGKSSPGPVKAKNCDPPYTVDSSGIRRPKLECL